MDKTKQKGDKVMKKFVFFWQSGRVYNEELKKWVDGGEPNIRCGSDGLVQLDGRLNIGNIRLQSEYLARKSKWCIGFSVGILDTNDPDNKKAQRFIEFTKLSN